MPRPRRPLSGQCLPLPVSARPPLEWFTVHCYMLGVLIAGSTWRREHTGEKGGGKPPTLVVRLKNMLGVTSDDLLGAMGSHRQYLEFSVSQALALRQQWNPAMLVGVCHRLARACHVWEPERYGCHVAPHALPHHRSLAAQRRLVASAMLAGFGCGRNLGLRVPPETACSQVSIDVGSHLCRRICSYNFTCSSCCSVVLQEGVNMCGWCVQ